MMHEAPNPAPHSGGGIRLAWLTDVHLEFLSLKEVDIFLEQVAQTKAEAVLIGGDTGTADTFPALLERVEAALERPIFFVLGNHDYYGGSMAKVRCEAAALSVRSRWLRWLPAAGLIQLTPWTGLLGHGSWADGRLGTGNQSTILLNDYLQIRDFVGLGLTERFQKLAELGDEAAAFFAEHLPVAAARFERLILLTHIPPFREAAWHQGRTSDEDWLPHFTCKAVGDVLVRVMEDHPSCHLTVLCGHTHGSGEVRILENLLVRTGGAVYGAPAVQEVLESH